MNNITYIVIPTALWYFGKVYFDNKKLVEKEAELKKININTKEKIKELQEKINKNLKEFKENMNTLRETLDFYYSQMKKIKED